jgi:hypothetical protein
VSVGHQFTGGFSKRRPIESTVVPPIVVAAAATMGGGCNTRGGIVRLPDPATEVAGYSQMIPPGSAECGIPGALIYAYGNAVRAGTGGSAGHSHSPIFTV